MEIQNINPMENCKNIELNINNKKTIKIYNENSRHIPTNLFILNNCVFINQNLIHENKFFCYTWDVIKNEKYKNSKTYSERCNTKIMENNNANCKSFSLI